MEAGKRKWVKGNGKREQEKEGNKQMGTKRGKGKEGRVEGGKERKMMSNFQVH